MRKIEMTPIAGEGPAVVEMVEGRRYIVVVQTPEGATNTQRAKAGEALAGSIPKGIDASTLVLPHGYRLEVYEDA